MSDLQHKHHHHHSEEHKREVSNRLARAIGHLQKVKQMVEDDEDCSDVLIQLAAVKSAINNTGKVILKDHMEHCIVHAVEDGDTEMIDELNAALMPKLLFEKLKALQVWLQALEHFEPEKPFSLNRKRYKCRLN